MAHVNPHVAHTAVHFEHPNEKPREHDKKVDTELVKISGTVGHRAREKVPKHADPRDQVPDPKVTSKTSKRIRHG